MTTVRRWERREGLPVHRQLHEKQGSIVAFTDELDAWWAARTFRETVRRNDGADVVVEEAARSEESGASRAGVPTRRVAGTLVTLLLLLVPQMSSTVLRWRADRGDRRPVVAGLVVLPLTNTSGHADQDYFADGMTAWARTEEGRAFHRARRYADADDRYKRALALDPGFAPAIDRLVQLDIVQRRLPEAETG